MPEIFSNSLKMSLLSGLFVFVAPSGFTIYSLFLCFILRNTLILSTYSSGNTNFSQKLSFISSNYTKASHKKLHTIGSCLPFYMDLQKQTISTLHFNQYSIKPSKALNIYLHCQLYPIFQVRYRSFFNQNPTL
jgi:hypothetical protein